MIEIAKKINEDGQKKKFTYPNGYNLYKVNNSIRHI